MKTIYTYLVGFLLLSQISFSQIGIGTTMPDATLDIKASNPVTPANNDGILIPKVDAFPVTPPTIAQEGMLVFLRVASGTNLPGFYYWDGISSWIKISSGVSNDWSLLGNTATNAATNFLGTTDDVDFVFKRNGIRAGFIGNPIAATATTVDRNNTSLGANSLLTPATGYRNTAIGSNVLPSNTTGKINVAVGDKSMFTNTTGSENTAVGVGTLFSNAVGTNNTAVGRNALTTSTASFNTAIGHSALLSNTTGTGDLAIGNSALFKNTTGNFNTGSGSQALANNTTGNNNTALGFQTLAGGAPLGGANPNVTTGNNNTAVGYQSFYNNLLGNNNVGLGYQAGLNELGSDKLYIENSNADANNALVYGEFTAGAKVLRTNSTFQIGNPTVTGYSFPTTRPATPAGQVLQYNAAGALTFQAPATALNSFAWLTTGNSGMLAASNFIGTTDANPLVFRSSNIERMRIVQTTGEVVIGATIPFAGDKFSAYGTGAQFGVNGYSTLTGVGVYGENSGTGLAIFGNNTSTGVGVEGDSTSSGIGVFGFNNGTGFAIQGNNTSTGFGVGGISNGVNGAVVGQANVANGIGTRGFTNGLNGSGVLGTASGAGSTGVFGSSSGTGTASGIWGRGTGVTNGTGVLGAGNGLVGTVSTSGSGGAFSGTSFGTVSFGTTVASGIGIAASGNNIANTTLNAFGAGGAFAASSYGVTSFAAITGNANNAVDRATFFGQYTSVGTTTDNVYVGARIAGVNYKILGTGGGSVSTTMPTTQGERIMFAPEATENWFFDMGEVQLINGKATVALDPIFVETISDIKPFKVFVQGAENTLGAIRITRNQRNKTFELHDVGGESNGIVQFSIYAIWKGKENLRMPIYDSNLKHQSKKIETTESKEKNIPNSEIIIPNEPKIVLKKR
jgi:hypothetical protein